MFPLDETIDPRLQLDYRDLILREEDGPTGVVRIASTTVAYVLRGTEQPVDPRRIQRMRRLLAQRDDAPFLVVVTPGRLAVYGVDLDRLSADDALIEAVAADESTAPSTFRRLHQEPAKREHVREQARRQAIHELLYGLLTTAIDGLHGLHGFSRADAIALSGRALFMRFLVDRRVIGGARKSPGEICPGADTWESLFSSAERFEQTSAWINSTFNGDFLPVSQGAFAQLSDLALDFLRAIMRRSAQAQMSFQDLDLDTPFAWDDLDFAHIPAGVLSQVYERQAERWDPNRRKQDSVYYTPRRIAEYMVREAFARLDVLNVPRCDARVLDPSVGGGVFLVAAFREMVADWRRRNGRWPSSRRLRAMLYRQLAGFDIQDSALSLTSLSLYLTVIELDAPPYRFEDLRFDQPLRGSVLFALGEPAVSDDAPESGSLGRAVPAGHEGQYDVVIGNPPWTSLPGDVGRQVIEDATDLLRPVVEARLGPERARDFVIPDQVPDLPFVWRAMTWARPGRVLAFALHARLLFKSTPQGRRAREDLFGALSVWGLLNGADLRFTPVWPEVLQPFCLLFADNVRPPTDHVFYLSSPYFEPALNESGRLRIDPDALQPIAPARLQEVPWLLKALFRGTPLDVQLLERLTQKELPSLAEWWEARGLAAGDGYQKSSDEEDAGPLLGRPELTARAKVGLVIDAASLPRFERARVHRTRDVAIYEGPLLILRESVRVKGDRAHVSDAGVVFSESFYGYSAHGHEDGRRLVRYLCLLLHSDLFVWFNLMTGGRFGVEREVWSKQDIDTFPIVPFDRLSSEQLGDIDSLFARLSAREPSREGLDEWIAELYGLGRHAAEVMADTLRMTLPHRENRTHAAGTPEPGMITEFVRILAARLTPLLRVSVQEVPTADEDPYRVVLIGANDSPPRAGISGLRKVLEMADQKGSSECKVVDVDGRIWLGRLAQRRYWTASRARLTAARLIEEHHTPGDPS